VDRKSDFALKMGGITKRFPGVLANDNITFELKRGEVHGLLGENGAGKTTLMNILFGLYQQDRGEIFINGEKVHISSPKQASDFGVGMVHQHFMLVENLTGLENVVLGLPLERPPLLDLDPARARFEELTTEYELDLDPSTPVWQLPVGDQQWLEFLKLLFRDTSILILDEPTAVLAPSQVEKLIKTIRQLADEGRSIVFISHKLKEMRKIADRITVLRDGHVVGTVASSETTPSELAQMMVGRDVYLDRRPRSPSKSEKVVLEIKGLFCQNDRGTQSLNDVDLTIYAGEIVGVAGVDGNGQRELAECIGGLRKPTGGTIEIDGKPVTGVVRDTSLLGCIPEDRHKTGLVLEFGVDENLILRNFADPEFTRRGIMHWGAIQRHAETIITQYDIRTQHSMTPVRFLSGGNQQKVVVARELSGKPTLVIAGQATRGLDVSAIESVHDVLLRERERGSALLFISTELPEVIALSDRIIVMFDGQIMGELDAEDANVDVIGELMLGHRQSEQMPSGGLR
jgi:simple sugar transport system ATP-binding protein